MFGTVDVMLPNPPAFVGISPGSKPTTEIGVLEVCSGPGLHPEITEFGLEKFGVFEILKHSARNWSTF
jgi:hypothetical protein